jgi:hypothetical protein
MAGYDPADEIGLIGHWQAMDEDKLDPRRIAFYRGSPDEAGKAEDIMNQRMAARQKGLQPSPDTSLDQKVTFLRVPVAGFAGHEIDAETLSKEQQDHEQGSLLVFEDTHQLANASGALIPGSLRENALNRAWLKLDLQKLGKIDNLMTASGNSLVVIQNHQNHVADLTAYERGLIDYAMPRLREVIDRETGLPKHKFITICRKCLSGSQQMLEYMEKSEAQVYANLDQRRGQHDDVSTPQASKNRFADSPTTAGSTTPAPLKGRGRMSVLKSQAYDKHNKNNSLNAEADDFVTTGSALKLMLDRIFDKLDVQGQGFLDETPDPSLAALTSFESALIELAQFRLQYELKAGGVLQKSQVAEILRETMDQDYPLGDEDDPMKAEQAGMSKDKGSRKATRGYPPLETAMRSVYREARKFRSEKTELTMEEKEKLECTFTPMINSNPVGPSHATTAARSRHQIFSGSGTRSMSTKDMKEYVELQECTFSPNLYKHLSNSKTKIHKAMYDFDPDHPQYRTRRRDANILVKELQKREHLEGHASGALHMHGCRGKWYWQETLRQDNAESQYTSNERADPEERVKPDAGMDLGMRREKHNWQPVHAEPRDWGKYIRVNDVRYGAVLDKRAMGIDRPDDPHIAQDPEVQEEASKAFADAFLTMRQSRGRMRSRGVFM